MTSNATPKPLQQGTMNPGNPGADDEGFPDPHSFSGTFKEFMRTAHDLGGEAGGPIRVQEREQMPWETNTLVTCECLAWRGIWNHTEKLRRVVDLGEKQYFSLPYAGRFLLSATRAMVDKRLVTLAELTNKIDEVKKRYEHK
ncbi:MAG TPA: nitrile hydratase subunit beta [Thiobacillaceae bacterium]|nr:nitrile hydratase subunit beta [Thiobacillaceae bacterium]